MPEPTPTTAEPTIEKKIAPVSTVVESVNRKIQANADYLKEFEQWEIKKSVAEKTKVKFTDKEPKKNGNAIRGEKLEETATQFGNKITDALSKQSVSEDKQEHRPVVDLLAQLKDISDPEEKYYCSISAVIKIASRTFDTRQQDLLTIGQNCPEAVQEPYFGEIVLDSVDSKIRNHRGWKQDTIKDKDTIQLLDLVSSENSALHEEAKTEARLMANEGRGMRLYDATSEYNRRSTLKVEPKDLLNWMDLNTESINENQILKAVGNLTIDAKNLPVIIARLSRNEGFNQQTQEQISRELLLGL